MLLATVVVLSLNVDPSGVLLLNRQGLGNEELKKALNTLDAELTRAGVPAWQTEETSKQLKTAGASEPSTCAGKPPCLVGLAAKANLPWLVTVSVSRLGKDRAWVVEILDVKKGVSVGREDWLDETNADISAPASRLATRLATVLRPPDVPVATVVEPTPKVVPVAPPPAIIVTQPAPAQKTLPIVLLVGSGVAAAAAIGLAVGSGVTHGRLLSDQKTSGDLKLSNYTTTQANELLATTNTLTGLAIASGLVAAGLGVGAIFTF